MPPFEGLSDPKKRQDRFFAVFFPDPGPFFGGSPGGSAGPFFCRFPLKKGAPGVSEKNDKKRPCRFLGSLRLWVALGVISDNPCGRSVEKVKFGGYMDGSQSSVRNGVQGAGLQRVSWGYSGRN